MKYWFAVFIGIIPFFAKGQLAEVDSLQKQLRQTAKAEIRADIFNKLSAVYNRISLTNSEQYAKRALEEAVRVKYNAGMAEAYNNLGVSASIRGSYSEGLDFFIKALKLREGADDHSEAAKTLNNIAGVYLYQRNFDKAIGYSEQSLELVRKGEDHLSIGNALVSLAMIYTEKKDTATALSDYFQALDEFSQLADKRREVQTLIRIGLLEKDKEKEKILATCLKAAAELQPETDFMLAIDYYKTIAEIYSGMDKRNQAYIYFHRALALADRFYDNQSRIHIRSELAELFRKDDRYDSALWYYKSFTELNDKTTNAEKASQLVILEKVYDSEKKDQQIQMNQQEIQSLGTVIGAISVMLVLVAISGFVLFRYYRQKREANVQLQKLISAISSQARELQVANNEIKRINEHLEDEVNHRTQEIKVQNEKLIDYVHFNSHEVRGPVARILGLADLMKKDPTTDEIMNISHRIQVAAQELDTVIRELNKKLETD